MCGFFARDRIPSPHAALRRGSGVHSRRVELELFAIAPTEHFRRADEVERMALEARLGQRLARGMMIHQSGASGAVRSRAPTAGVASGALLGEREQRGVWLNDDVVSNY